MAHNVVYLWNKLSEEGDATYSTSADVAFFGYADGWNDGGQIVATDVEDAASALALSGKDAYLTIGGDYHAQSGADSYVVYLSTSEAPSSGNSVSAISFSQNGHVNFAAQSGAGSAGSVDAGEAANLDENIKIGVNHSSSGISSSTLTVSAIGAQKSLDVLGSITGTIDATFNYNPESSGFNSRTTQVAGIQTAQNLVIGNSFQANLNAKNTSSSSMPVLQGSTATAISGNTYNAFGMDVGGSIYATDGLWGGVVTVQNNSSVQSLASLYQKADEVRYADVTNNTVNSYGVRAAGDVTLRGFADGVMNVSASGVKIISEVADLAQPEPEEGQPPQPPTEFSTATVTGNAVTATGILAVNLTAADGAENMQLTVSATGNQFAAKNRGANENTAKTENNTVTATGIQTGSAITLGDVDAESKLGVTLSSNSGLYQATAYGINAGTTVTLGDVEGKLTVTASGNTFITHDDTQYGIVSAYGIYAGSAATLGDVSGDVSVTISGNTLKGMTGSAIAGSSMNLTIGDFTGNIAVTASGNNLLKPFGRWNLTAISTEGAFSARSLKGTISVQETGFRQSWSYDALVEFRDYVSGLSSEERQNTVSGIQVGALSVTGVFDTDVTVSTSVYIDTEIYGYEVKQDLMAYNAAISVGKLVASGFSGTINQGSISGKCKVGLQSYSGFSTFVNGDDFDVNGGIYNVGTGISSYGSLNLRISGEIDASDYAICAGSLYGNVSSSIYTDDSIRIASSAKITGNVELAAGNNEIIVDSGATIDGNLLATHGKLSLYFNLNKVNSNAVISTDENDVMLHSTTYLAINLNEARNNKLYKLFQFAGNVKEYWVDRTISFIYDNKSFTGKTDANGRLTCTSDDGSVTAKFAYNADNSITVVVSGVEALDAFDSTNVVTAYDAEKEAFVIDWSQCEWDIPEEEQGNKVVELVYQLKDASGNAYGESISVLLGSGETSYAVNGVLEGESVGWKLRYSSDLYNYKVSGWSSDDYQWETATAEPVEPVEPVEPEVPDVSQCNPLVGEAGDHDTTTGSSVQSSVARLFWTAAESEVPVEYYTVEYVETRNAITDAEEIAALFDTETVYRKEVTATEALVSGLTKGAYIYWRMKATDFDGGESEYQYGRSFQVNSLDKTAPKFTEIQETVQYDVTDPEAIKINGVLAWNAATDVQSGVQSYTVSYGLTGTEESTWTTTTVMASAIDPITIGGETYTYHVTSDEITNDDYTVKIFATDMALNVSAAETRTWKKDSTGPTFGSSTGAFTYSYDPEFAINATITWDAATDNQSGVKYYTVEGSITGTEEWYVAGTVEHVTGQETYTATLSGLANENYSYRITAYDYCGNASSLTKTDELKKDETGPELGRASGYVYYTYDPEFAINATITWNAATDNQSGVKYYTVEGSIAGTEEWYVAGTVEHVTGQETYTATLSGLTNQDYSYRITAYDYCGNASSLTKTDELKKDEIAPVLGDVFNVTSSYTVLNPAQALLSAEVTWSAGTDVGSGVKEYTFTYWKTSNPADQTTITVGADEIDPETGLYKVSFTENYKNESYEYQFSASDYCGNVSTVKTGTFGGEDKLAPTGKFTGLNTPDVDVEYDLISTGSTYKAEVASATVTFSWSDTYTDANSPVCYKIQLSNTPDFTGDYTYTFYNTPEDGKTFTLSNDVPTMSVGVLTAIASTSGTELVYWRVMAMDNPGNDASYALVTEGNETGVWSETGAFFFYDYDKEIVHTGDGPAVASNITLYNAYQDGCYVPGTSCGFTLAHEGMGVQSMSVCFSTCAGERLGIIPFTYGTLKVSDRTSTTVGVAEAMALPDGCYQVEVLTSDAYGNDSCSDAKIVYIDTTRPTTVTGFQFIQDDRNLTVTWDASYDAFGVAGYQLGYRYKTLDDSATWNWVDCSTTSATFLDMEYATYEFVAVALDQAYSQYGKSQSNVSLVCDPVEYTVSNPHTRSVVSNYNMSDKSDFIQFVGGLVYVTYDTENGYVQTPAINDVTGWNVVETRRDLTGDTLADIQILSDDGAGSTWVATLRNDYLQNGCITLNYQFIGAYDNELWSYVGSADVDGNGSAEILMMQTEAGSDHGLRHVAAWVTDSEGTWVANNWVGSMNGYWDIAGTADVDGNGTDNVILRYADGTLAYWSEAATNNLIEIANAGGSVLLTTGDFDGDGADDFLFSNSQGYFYAWTNIDGGVTQERIGNLSDLGGSWMFAGAGDYDGDGKEEILWCDTTACKVAYGEANKANFKDLTVIA